MNEATSSAKEAKLHSKGFLRRLAEVWQWLVVLFFALIVVALLSDQSKLAAPSAPVVLFWTTIGAGALVILAHAPPLFMRLSANGKRGAYTAAFFYFLLHIITFSQVAAAWEKTPKGAAEAKQIEVANKVAEAEVAHLGKIEAEAEARRQRDGAALREAEALQKQVEEIADKLEGCFTTFGHRLPALEKSIKDSVHNPDAFEHVETLAIAPDTERNNVAMKFRAENGFGAIRLGVVKASVDPDTCDIISVGDLEPM